MSQSPINTQVTILDSPVSHIEQTQEMEVSDATMTGTFLNDRFELLEVAGAGGMGTVYKALDRRDVEAGNSRFIAIKVLNVQHRDDTKLLKALHSETRKTQALAHANIIRVYDFDRDSEYVFMTMEYMEGVSLDKIIRGNPSGLAVDKALHLIEQLVLALDHAHSQGLVHSDLKPGNVLVATDDHLKVLDFGISRLLDFNRTNEFDAGVISAHTPAYATLEMVHGGSPDPRDDVYALACISYELMTGQHPFQRLSAENALQQALYPEPSDVFSSLQWQTIKQALSFDRQQRTATVKEFWQGMQPERNTTKRKWVKLISLLVLAGATLLIFQLSQQEGVAFFDRLVRSNVERQAVTEIRDRKKLAQPADVPSVLTTHMSLELNQAQFKLGETLEISFSVDQPSYVRIILVNSAGELINLFPNPFQIHNFCAPNKDYQVPPVNAPFTLDIEPPLGRDKVIAISSPVPFSESFIHIDKKGQLLRNNLPGAFVVTEKFYDIVSVN